MLDYDSNDKIERVFNYQFVFNNNFVLGDHARDEFKELVKESFKISIQQYICT